MRIAIFGNIDVEAQKDDEVSNHSINSYTLEGEYDQIIVSALPELRRNLVIPFLEDMRKHLRVRGELIFYVPSAEWAAKQIFTNQADNLAYYMLYGDSNKEYRACYTMLALRTLTERVGLITRNATQNILLLSGADGEKHRMPVHAITVTKDE